jgi:hypothetical protein
MGLAKVGTIKRMLVSLSESAQVLDEMVRNKQLINKRRFNDRCFHRDRELKLETSRMIRPVIKKFNRRQSENSIRYVTKSTNRTCSFGLKIK